MKANVRTSKTCLRTPEHSSQVGECLILRARKKLHARFEVAYLDGPNYFSKEWLVSLYQTTHPLLLSEAKLPLSYAVLVSPSGLRAWEMNISACSGEKTHFGFFFLPGFPGPRLRASCSARD